jgi:hypothetical protein
LPVGAESFNLGKFSLWRIAKFNPIGEGSSTGFYHALGKLNDAIHYTVNPVRPHPGLCQRATMWPDRWLPIGAAKIMEVTSNK